MSINVGLVSLGCAKNLVDSEIILGYMGEAGFRIVANPADADIIIINTCGFIGPAKEESIETILAMARYKQEGRCQGLVVTGCLSARYQEELLGEMPEIDGLLGTGEMDQIPEVIERILGGERVVRVGSEFVYDDPDVPRRISTGNHTAYLKIAEGCNHTCSFCIIPKIRGRYRSRQSAAVLGEAARLQQAGIKELVIVAQDTTRYGQDSPAEMSLPELLRELARLDIPWIRVLYTYPTLFTDALMDVMATEERIVNYVDLPLQHAAGSILKRMGRPGSLPELVDLVNRVRRHIPQVSVRSSFIVGFPGETDEEFQILLQFLQEAQLENAGIFRYSPEEGTRAFTMPNQIDEPTKEERYDLAMAVQQRVSLAANKRLVGQTIEVLIDGTSPESDLVLVGRHRGQAPHVDGVVYIGNRWADQGQLVQVCVTEAHAYDLVGDIVGEGEEG